jgi:hypothetical protein
MQDYSLKNGKKEETFKTLELGGVILNLILRKENERCGLSKMPEKRSESRLLTKEA